MSKLLLLPLSLYFFAVSYVLLTSPTHYDSMLTKSVLSLPQVLQGPAQFILRDKMGLMTLGGLFFMMGLMVMSGVKMILLAFSTLFGTSLLLVIWGIFSNSLEMQALSEALERIAYLSAISGMLLLASTVNNSKMTQVEDKQKKNQKKPKNE